MGFYCLVVLLTGAKQRPGCSSCQTLVNLLQWKIGQIHSGVNYSRCCCCCCSCCCWQRLILLCLVSFVLHKQLMQTSHRGFYVYTLWLWHGDAARFHSWPTWWRRCCILTRIYAAEFSSAYALQLCDAAESRRSAAWITVCLKKKPFFKLQLSFFCFLPLACRHLSLVPAIQSILPTVCSTNQTCVHPVLIQGLRSGHCCLAPLVLLRLGIEEADGTALVTVKPSWPSLHTEFCLQTSTIECLFWVSTVGCFCVIAAQAELIFKMNVIKKEFFFWNESVSSTLAVILLFALTTSLSSHGSAWLACSSGSSSLLDSLLGVRILASPRKVKWHR